MANVELKKFEYQSVLPKVANAEVRPCLQDLAPQVYYQVLNLRLNQHDEIINQLSLQLHQLANRVQAVETRTQS